MPSLSDHQSSRSTKLLLLGDSGSGKTGALTSLVEAGYTLRIIDMDNGLDPLVAHIRKKCPAKIGNVQYETLRDKVKGAQPDRISYVGTPDAFTKAMKLLDKWSDGTVPAQWDSRTVLVLDSLTHFGNAAFAWAMAMNPGSKEPRQWFFSAQRAVEGAIALLTSEHFAPNVIVSAHIQYQQLDEGTTRGFPNAVGQALGSKLMSYFNNAVQVERKGSGSSVKREIVTVPTAMVDLKNPAPFSIPPRMDIDSGLATFFAHARGEK